MRIQVSQQNTLPRWAWTEGLDAVGQMDIAVRLGWAPDPVRDQEVRNILAYVVEYVTGQSRRIQPEETLHYGWTTLRFLRSASQTDPSANRLEIEEVAHPLSATAPTFIPGVENAVQLVLAQDDVMRRNHLSGETDYPHRSSLAIVCKRVPPIGSQRPNPIILERIAAQEIPRDSGWVIRCADPTHNHDDPGEFVQMPLAMVVADFVQLFPYLALPADTMVSVGDRNVVIFQPGSETGKDDAGSPLQWVLKSA